MRIGTWNLEGKWFSDHLAVLEGQECDRGLTTQPDPHPATALAHGDGLRLMCSVLPWRSCGASWEGSAQAEKLGLLVTSDGGAT